MGNNVIKFLKKYFLKLLTREMEYDTIQMQQIIQLIQNFGKGGDKDAFFGKTGCLS